MKQCRSAVKVVRLCVLRHFKEISHHFRAKYDGALDACETPKVPLERELLALVGRTGFRSASAALRLL